MRLFLVILALFCLSSCDKERNATTLAGEWEWDGKDSKYQGLQIVWRFYEDGTCKQFVQYMGTNVYDYSYKTRGEELQTIDEFGTITYYRIWKLTNNEMEMQDVNDPTNPIEHFDRIASF